MWWLFVLVLGAAGAAIGDTASGEPVTAGVGGAGGLLIGGLLRLVHQAAASVSAHLEQQRKLQQGILRTLEETRATTRRLELALRRLEVRLADLTPPVRGPYPPAEAAPPETR